MTLGRRVGLLAAAFLLPPTVAVSVFTSWTGARQMEDLIRLNLDLEVSQFHRTCSDEYGALKALAIEDMDFYRQNTQQKMLDWAKANGPKNGFLFVLTDTGQRLLAPAFPLAKTMYLEQTFAPWGWTLGAAVSLDYLGSFSRQTLWNTIWVDLAAALPLLWAARILSRSISRPLARLQASAQALARGDFASRAVPSGAPEIQSLALAFNTMADHIQDLTASLEDRVRIRTEELERSQREMARKERLASLGGMVAGVAHEINTPLGICVTSASTLDNETRKLDKAYRAGAMTQADFEGFLETMTEGFRLLELNLDRAHELVSSFKRLSVDQMAEQRREFIPAQYVLDIVASLSHELKVAQVSVTVSGGEGVRLVGDPGLFSQILLNWLMNSLVHGFAGSQGGEIRIRLNPGNQGLGLEYSDNGAGMDPRTLERLYEPFFTTKPGTGSGLGMSLVYAIVVSKLGGTIEAESRPGGGTRFRVFLPFNAEGFSLPAQA